MIKADTFCLNEHCNSTPRKKFCSNLRNRFLTLFFQFEVKTHLG